MRHPRHRSTLLIRACWCCKKGENFAGNGARRAPVPSNSSGSTFCLRREQLYKRATPTTDSADASVREVEAHEIVNREAVEPKRRRPLSRETEKPRDREEEQAAIEMRWRVLMRSQRNTSTKFQRNFYDRQSHPPKHQCK
jgi:hypothetical protein